MRFLRFFFPLLVFALVLLAAASPALAAVTLHGEDWLTLAALVVPLASALANLTKTDADNKAVGWFSRLVNIFALNFKRSGL